jgi:hypothetical protein
MVLDQTQEMGEPEALEVVAQSMEQLGLEEHLPKVLYLARQFTEMLAVMVIRTIITIQHQAAAALPKRVDGLMLLMDEAVLVNYFLTSQVMEPHQEM